MNKFTQPRPYVDPEVAARKIIEPAHAVEPIQDGLIYIYIGISKRSADRCGTLYALGKAAKICSPKVTFNG
jgi:hypothetical protein